MSLALLPRSCVVRLSSASCSAGCLVSRTPITKLIHSSSIAERSAAAGGTSCDRFSNWNRSRFADVGSSTRFSPDLLRGGRPFAILSGHQEPFGCRGLRTASAPYSAMSVNASSSPLKHQRRLFAEKENTDEEQKFRAEYRELRAKLAEAEAEEDKKLSLSQRFKKMFKQYWYVLLPVHFGTCTAWFALFYGVAMTGIDIVPLLETFHCPALIVDKIRDAPMAGHFVVALTLYKLSTPLRYMTTLGVTYYAVKYLSRLGYIKPMPSRQRLKAILEEKRAEFRERRRHWRQEKRLSSFRKRPSTSNQKKPE